MYTCKPPRSNIYAKAGILENFGEMLDNIFRPLFNATAYPEEYPVLSKLLEQIVGFDSVDDESKPEPVQKRKYVAYVTPVRRLDRSYLHPSQFHATVVYITVRTL